MFYDLIISNNNICVNNKLTTKYTFFSKTAKHYNFDPENQIVQKR